MGEHERMQVLMENGVIVNLFKQEDGNVLCIMFNGTSFFVNEVYSSTINAELGKHLSFYYCCGNCHPKFIETPTVIKGIRYDKECDA